MDGVNVLINKSLAVFDLSHNPDILEDSGIFLSPFIEIVKAKGPAAVAAAGATSYICVCKGNAKFSIQDLVIHECQGLIPDIQFIV